MDKLPLGHLEPSGIHYLLGSPANLSGSGLSTSRYIYLYFHGYFVSFYNKSNCKANTILPELLEYSWLF
jgi:hypothetical protein